MERSRDSGCQSASTSGYSKFTSGFDKDNNVIKRSYTPINRVEQPGFVDLLVKVYLPSPQFPEGGQLTQYINTLQVGDFMTMDGPKGKLEYMGQGLFRFVKQGLSKRFRKVSMVAGGTGIAPCYQLMLHMLEEEQGYEITLIFANRTPADILMKEELDRFEDMGVKIVYTVDRADADWKGYTGFVTKKMIAESLSAPAESHLMLYCGPRPMNKELRKALLELGHDEAHVFKF